MKHKKSPQVSLVNRAVERRSDLVERIDNPFNHQIFSGMMPVTVVQLRRRESLPHGNQASWSLSYRYMRRGFWRKQFQREIWIAPTMVGDESLPFNKRSVVNVVSR